MACLGRDCSGCLYGEVSGAVVWDPPFGFFLDRRVAVIGISRRFEDGAVVGRIVRGSWFGGRGEFIRMGWFLGGGRGIVGGFSAIGFS